MTHELKTDHPVFQETWDGKKQYEIRLDDRKFKVGDEIQLVETQYTGIQMRGGAPLEYSFRRIRAVIIHKLSNQYGIKDGWCILGIELQTRLSEKMAVCKWNGNEWEETHNGQ